MKKYLFTLLMLLGAASPLAVKAESAIPGQWRVHNALDSYFRETIDTPKRLYTLALGNLIVKGWTAWEEVNGQLFVTDKATGETIGYNANNYLNGNVIMDIEYNSAKGYLLIIYTDYNIDILYDDDTVYSIPALASASISSSKNINSITFDPEHNRAYLATDFGYMVIDDKNYVICESRIYNTPLNSIACVGDKLVLGCAQGLFTSPLEDRHSSFDSFTPVPGHSSNVKYVLPLSEKTFAFIEDKNITHATFADDGSLTMNVKSTEQPAYVAMNRDGYFLRRANCAMQLDRTTGDVTNYYTDKTGRGSTECSSWDMQTFYFPVASVGVEQYSYENETTTWTKGFTYAPNAPQTYITFYFDYSPDYGMLAGNSTVNRFYDEWTANYRNLISGYKDGTWTPHGRTSSMSSPFQNYMRDTYGPVVDPLFPDYMWVGSRRHGLFRCNLADNSIEMFSNPKHAARNNPGFHAVFPYSDQWSQLCYAMAPSFDDKGNMWVFYNTSHVTGDQMYQPLFCWKAEDRKSGNVEGFKNVPITGYGRHWECFTITATKSPYSPGFVLFSPTRVWCSPFYMFYHAGTIDDTSDDKTLYYTKVFDQDGAGVSFTYINNFREDPATGNVWVCTDAGVFYFDPKEALKAGDSGETIRVRRVKVARNDGTNLADYLLNGYDVTDMAIDGAGRKWFTTAGNGVFVTSPDGSQPIEHFTADNSKLPSDVVYSVGFDPSSNAVWFGGNHQISTYYCDATFPSEDYSEVLAFPNPVRPEYQGPVTIRGLMADSLVKIADASGNVIKELGLSNGGMAVWDLTDGSGRPVGAGVYYVLSSTSTESQQAAGSSTKILVVR